MPPIQSKLHGWQSRPKSVPVSDWGNPLRRRLTSDRAASSLLLCSGRLKGPTNSGDGWGFYWQLADNGYCQQYYPNGFGGNEWIYPAKGIWECPAVNVRRDGSQYVDSTTGEYYARVGHPEWNIAWNAGAHVKMYTPELRTTTNYVESWGWYGNSYGAYWCQRYYKECEMRQPSQVLLVNDGVAYRYTYMGLQQYGQDPNGWMYLRHRGHFNGLLRDAHVASVRFNDFLAWPTAQTIAALRADRFPILRAPHAKISASGTLTYISPSQYP